MSGSLWGSLRWPSFKGTSTIALTANTTPVAHQGRTPKKVLFVTNTGIYGGAEKHLEGLLRAFDGTEDRISLLCLQDAFVDYGKEKLDITCHRELASKKRLCALFSWFWVLRKIRPDAVVFIHFAVWAFPWQASVGAWLAGIRKRFAIEHSLPDPIPATIKGRLHRRRLWIAHLLYRKIICVSNAVREGLVHSNYRFSANKTITIHNGVALAEFQRDVRSGMTVRTKLGIGLDEFLWVCTSRLSEEKGVDILLLAMARVLRQGVKCKCVILGDGPLRQKLGEQAHALQLGGHVFFEGFQKDVRSYLCAADAFVLSSRRESLGIAILEALACGLPCLVTDAGGTSEVVAHGINGLLVAPGSPVELADAIASMVTQPSERGRMSSQARITVRNRFDLETRMADIRRVITD